MATTTTAKPTAAAAAATAIVIPAATMVAVPARPNLPAKGGYAPVPATVPACYAVGWHGTNGTANSYLRLVGCTPTAMLALASQPVSAKRLGGLLAPAVASMFANGPVPYSALLAMQVGHYGTLASHLSYLTGHGMVRPVL